MSDLITAHAELQKRFVELDAELDKYISGEANEYRQSQQRIAELEELVRLLRIAMDYLLRSPAGVVPSETDRFYDSNRATFQDYDKGDV